MKSSLGDFLVFMGVFVVGMALLWLISCWVEGKDVVHEFYNHLYHGRMHFYAASRFVF